MSAFRRTQHHLRRTNTVRRLASTNREDGQPPDASRLRTPEMALRSYRSCSDASSPYFDRLPSRHAPPLLVRYWADRAERTRVAESLRSISRLVIGVLRRSAPVGCPPLAFGGARPSEIRDRRPVAITNVMNLSTVPTTASHAANVFQPSLMNHLPVNLEVREN